MTKHVIRRQKELQSLQSSTSKETIQNQDNLASNLQGPATFDLNFDLNTQFNDLSQTNDLFDTLEQDLDLQSWTSLDECFDQLFTDNVLENSSQLLSSNGDEIDEDDLFSDLIFSNATTTTSGGERAESENKELTFGVESSPIDDLMIDQFLNLR